MQNAKDSFYVALRARLVGINPERTILLRAVVRPGILVEEAEAPFAQLPTIAGRHDRVGFRSVEKQVRGYHCARSPSLCLRCTSSLLVHHSIAQSRHVSELSTGRQCVGTL